ncbi:hypothetical protein MWN63_04820 [Paradonghicola geojensis]|nr:hypothetical protein [Marivivens geojensis]
MNIILIIFTIISVITPFSVRAEESQWQNQYMHLFYQIYMPGFDFARDKELSGLLKGIRLSNIINNTDCATIIEYTFKTDTEMSKFYQDLIREKKLSLQMLEGFGQSPLDTIGTLIIVGINEQCEKLEMLD